MLTRAGDWSGLRRALAESSAEELLEAGQGRRRPRARRRRLPGGHEVGVRAQGEGRSQGDRRQRRRGRPGLLHRQGADGGQPGAAARGPGAGRATRSAPSTASCSSAPSTRAPSPRSTRRSARARAEGLLGDDILGSGFSFDVTVIEGAGSYVVGEETALLSCLQGLRGTVSARPPFPAERGVHGLPTVVNNVETLCNMPFIARHGADAYRALSPEGATPGSKLVCFNERFARPGVYEVPFGMTMRALCEDVAGGLRDGRSIKALQIGGPLGGILPASLLDTRVRLRAARRPRAAWSATAASSPSTTRPTCAPSPATCCTSAPPRAAASASRAGSGCAARTRCSRGRRRGRPRGAWRSCSRRSSSAACARTAAACRRRSAASWRTSPSELGLA